MKKAQLLLLAILLLAGLLRFYHFPQRWWLHADQARDALVARGAVEAGKLPLIGSFSSAGPFVFGPGFYWLVILTYWLFPQWLVAPWIVFTLIDVLLVWVMYRLGRAVADQRLGLVLALFSAVSPAQLLRASNLTQHSLVLVLTGLTVLSLVLFLKKNRLAYLFWLGLSIGGAINMHYQALNLLVFGGIAVVLAWLRVETWLERLKAAGLLLLGLVIVNLPLLYWDFHQDWANLRNILDFFLIGQYRFWVSNRWLTYLSQFWPEYWARVIGGRPLLAKLLIVMVIGMAGWRLVKAKLKKTIFWLGVGFAVQLVLNRYYRGERLWGYLLYFHPLVLLLSGWLLVELVKINKWLGWLIIGLLLLFTVEKSWTVINNQDNQVAEVKQVVSWLREEYPGQTLAIYDFYYQSPSLSQMLSLFLDFEGLASEEGEVVLGVSQGPVNYLEPIKVVDLDQQFFIYQLDQHQVDQPEWRNVNPDYVYQDIGYWWKKKPLESSFSLPEYLKTRFLK